MKRFIRFWWFHFKRACVPWREELPGETSWSRLWSYTILQLLVLAFAITATSLIVLIALVSHWL